MKHPMGISMKFCAELKYLGLAICDFFLMPFIGFAFFFSSNVIANAPFPAVVIPVATPFESEAAKRIRNLALEALDKFILETKGVPAAERPVFKLILDFNPQGKAFTSEFGPAYDLAQSLRLLKNRGSLTIFGWVHGEVQRHGVLPLLACDNIYYSKDALVGGVVGDSGEFLSNTIRTAYDEITAGRFARVVIRKMYAPDLVIVKATNPKGREIFVERGEDPQGEIVLQAGKEGRYDFAAAKTFGISEQEPAETLGALAAILRLSAKSLGDATVSNRELVPWRIVLTGPINPELFERFKRRVSRAVGQGANCLILQFECGQGMAESALEIASFIRDLEKSSRVNPIKTIAFHTTRARDLSLIMSLACSKIIMEEGASLGPLDDALISNPETRLRLRTQLEDLLQEKIASKLEAKLLAEAFLNSSSRIALVVHKVTGETKLIDSEDLVNQPALKLELQIKPFSKEDENKPLRLRAEQATDSRIGMVNTVAKDVESALLSENFKMESVPISGTDWLDELAEFLTHPWTRVVLIMLAITCLILEVKMPGISLPGVLSAFFFVLFFWSHSQFSGQIFWLAIFLFFLGMILIGVEIFILPGFGITGIAGILLVLGSLGLVAYGHWPKNPDEWVGLGKSMAPYGISCMGALVSVVIIAQFLPSMPMTSKLFLKPPEYDDQPLFAEDELHQGLAGLLGSIGVAETSLHPSGKAKFGDHWLDVVSDGGFIVQGAKIKVCLVEGSKIVVCEVF
ncbi:MAG: hypothetical protein DWH95_03910 [Planctomycetota bacterium]|nr:MAG: hypothetical protein DWH95_03910 [Planctomycetota bacterium]